MKKVLLITDVNFWEECSGNRLRILKLVKYLSKKVALTVVNTGPAPLDIEVNLNKIFEANFFVLEKSDYLSSTGYGRRLKAFLVGKQFDVIIIEYIHSSYFLDYINQDAITILDAHDIISERAKNFKKFNFQGALFELPRKTEFKIFNIYDYVVALCEPDLKIIQSAIGLRKSLLCPHPPTTCRYYVRKKVKNITFIGSAYLPNIDGINHFISSCWPQISKNYEVDLFIYGTVAAGRKSSACDDKVHWTGFEQNINRIYSEADIIINPVRFGAGLKIKNVEALANGKALVTTTHGARGLTHSKKECFLIADNRNDFIKAIISLIGNFTLRETLSKNAYDFISKQFSAEDCFKPLINAITNCK